MAVILQVTDGPASGRRTFVRSGQVLRVGRTERADFDVPQDVTMAPVHFAVEYDSQVCRLRDLRSGASTMLNGERVSEAELRHGDRITAGATTFRVQFDGAQTAPPPVAPPASFNPEPTATAGASGFKHVTIPTAAEVCKLFQLNDDAAPLLEPKQSPREFFKLLTKRQLYPDAARLLAHALPKREAVWWAAQSVRRTFADRLTLIDKRAVEAAEAWVIDPSESNRRAAHAAAEATQYETAAGWAAAGAFWSGGSIAPPGLPDVPPKEVLTPQAAVVAISLSANSDPPHEAPQRYAEFMSLGIQVADGEQRWPEKKS